MEDNARDVIGLEKVTPVAEPFVMTPPAIPPIVAVVAPFGVTAGAWPVASTIAAPPWKTAA